MKKLFLIYLCLVATSAILNAQGPTARAVTQTGALTNPVTINSEVGVITTVAATGAGATATSFQVNNSAVTPTTTVIADVQGYSGTYGTNGFPVIATSNVIAGSFTLTIMNVHGSNALNGILNIGFVCR